MVPAVRLFVSSTFRDMQAERDALARLCFPQARRTFAARGQGFVEIDLRWGLRLDETEESIVGLCLREVAICRGFFVGILGARYGHVPQHLPVAATDLHAPPGTSVTEYEIRAGAFAGPATSFVRFFFRGDGAHDEPAMRRLKGDIQARGLWVRHFETPEDLARLLLNELEQLAQEQAEPVPVHHLADRLVRLHGQVFHAQPGQMDRLNEWWVRGPAYMMVCGPEGVGKTALICHWLQRLREGEVPSASSWRKWLGWGEAGAASFPLLAIHFAGASFCSGALSRAIDDLCAQLGEGAETQPLHGGLAQRLVRWHDAVLAACERGRDVLLVLDGLDDILSSQRQSLQWLPPPHARLHVLLSVRRLPGQDLPPNWRCLQLTPPTTADRDGVVRTLLAAFGKQLEPADLQCVVGSPALRTPAQLRFVAEELRLLGSPDRVARYARVLATRQSAAELGEDFLERLEAELGEPLVRDVCGLLAVSRGGLPEGELRALAQERQAVSGVEWSALMQSFRKSVLDRHGRLGLFDSMLQVAVECRYFKNPHDAAICRERLVRFHSDGQILDNPPPRTLEELPWQLEALGHADRLLALLRQPGFCAALWQHDPERCLTLWRSLLTSRRDADLDRQAAAWSRSGSAERLALAFLLLVLGRTEAAVRLAPKPHESPNLAARISLSALLMELGDAVAALAALEETSADAPASDVLRAGAMGARANALLALGRAEEALQLHQQSVALFAVAGEPIAQARGRHNQALCCIELHRYREALKLLSRCADLFVRVRDHQATALCELHSADVHDRLGHTQKALAALRQARLAACAAEDTTLLARVLTRLAQVLEVSGQRDEAERVQLERQRLCAAQSDLEGELQARLDRVAIRMNLGPRGVPAAAQLLRVVQDWMKQHDVAPSAKTGKRLNQIATQLGVAVAPGETEFASAEAEAKCNRGD